MSLKQWILILGTIQGIFGLVFQERETLNVFYPKHYDLNITTQNVKEGVLINYLEHVKTDMDKILVRIFCCEIRNILIKISI